MPTPKTKTAPETPAVEESASAVDPAPEPSGVKEANAKFFYSRKPFRAWLRQRNHPRVGDVPSGFNAEPGQIFEVTDANSWMLDFPGAFQVRDRPGSKE